HVMATRYLAWLAGRAPPLRARHTPVSSRALTNPSSLPLTSRVGMKKGPWRRPPGSLWGVGIEAVPRLLEDLGGAVAAREVHFVAAGVAEVDEEALVQRHAALGVAVDLDHPGLQLRVELVVPDRVERVRHVEPPAVHAELQHLRAAVARALPVIRVADHPAQPDLASQLRVTRVADVVLAQVAVQPVGEV